MINSSLFCSFIIIVIIPFEQSTILYMILLISVLDVKTQNIDNNYKIYDELL